MKVPIELVKELREKTGLGVMDCKKALEEAEGNMDKAIEILKRKGVKISEKKAGRKTKEGLIGAYVHLDGKIGVLVEVNCETDFVAKTDDFKELVKNLALQIAATSPLWIDRESVPENVIEEKKKEIEEEFKDKPKDVIEKIVSGKMEEFFKEKVLLEQPFIKDENITIKDYLTSKIAKLGENIRIKRFVRFEIGE
ncbi:MAG: translation elongation factor Ts [Candidatus Omnitrophota bacterium]|nr:MAG: translation elongation factor Ts [Candidatus Omnitrophota bacterium]